MGGKLPVNAFLFCIALICPRHHFLTEFLNRSKSTSFDTLGGQCTQLVFRNVQPATMLWRRDDIQSSRQGSCHARFQRIVKCTDRMSVQVVANPSDFFDIGKILLQENPHFMCPILFCFEFTNGNATPSSQRLREHKNIRNTRPFVFIIDTPRMVSRRGNRRSCFLEKLHWLLIHDDDRCLNFVGKTVNIEYCLHPRDELPARFWRDYPVLHFATRDFVFFSVLRTVT